MKSKLVVQVIAEIGLITKHKLDLNSSDEYAVKLPIAFLDITSINHWKKLPHLDFDSLHFVFPKA